MRCLTRIRLPLVAFHQPQSHLPHIKIFPSRHYSTANTTIPKTKKPKKKKFFKRKKSSKEGPPVWSYRPPGQELDDRIKAEALARGRVLTEDEKEDVRWEISTVAKLGRHEGVWDQLLGAKKAKDEDEVEKVDVEEGSGKIRFVGAMRRRELIVRPVLFREVKDGDVEGEQGPSDEANLKIRRVGALRWRDVVRPVQFGEEEAGVVEERPVEDRGLKISIVRANPRKGLIIFPPERFEEEEDGDVEGPEEDVVEKQEREVSLKEMDEQRSVHFKGVRKVKMLRSDGERHIVFGKSRAAKDERAAKELEDAEELELRQGLETRMRKQPNEIVHPSLKVRRVLATAAEEPETAQDTSSQPFWKHVAIQPLTDESTTNTPTIRLTLSPPEKRPAPEQGAKANQGRDVKERIARIAFDSRLTKKDNVRALHFNKAGIMEPGNSKPVDQERAEKVVMRVRRYIRLRVRRPISLRLKRTSRIMERRTFERRRIIRSKFVQFKLNSRFKQSLSKQFTAVRKVPTKIKSKNSSQVPESQEAVLDPMAAFDAMWSDLDSGVTQAQKTAPSNANLDAEASPTRTPSDEAACDDVWSDIYPEIPPTERFSIGDSFHAQVPEMDHPADEAISSKQLQATAPIRNPSERKGRNQFDTILATAKSNTPKKARKLAKQKRKKLDELRKLLEEASGADIPDSHDGKSAIRAALYAVSSDLKSRKPRVKKPPRQRRYEGIRKFYEGVSVQKYASVRGLSIRKQFSMGKEKEKAEVDPESPRERARRMAFERKFGLVEDVVEHDK